MFSIGSLYISVGSEQENWSGQSRRLVMYLFAVNHKSGLLVYLMAPKRAVGFVVKTLGSLMLFLLSLLWQQHSLDVGKNATLSDGDASQQLVQLLVVADSQLKMTGNDSGLLVVASSVARQLKDLGAQILEHLSL